MIKFRALLALPLLMLACAPQGGVDSSGRGDPAPLVYAPPGTQFTLANSSNGKPSETRIAAGNPAGPRGAFVRPDGAVGTFYPGCWSCGGGFQIEEAKYAALWPLETGKSVSFLRTAPDGNRARVTISVTGTETIEIPAGTFDTYVLSGRVEHLTGPSYSANVRAFWAPRPGWVIRAEGSDSRGNQLTSTATEIIER